ncbi:Flp pilus assembly protein CpaB [Paraburkholderia phytofirmans]|uniref:Flp pilus assembly protein CpaB n=1 Tax=Paraburkholderia phytofirmans TaxID=261302 RepID=A0ABW9BMU9_9BURK
MLKKIKFRSLLANSWILLFLAVLVATGLTFLLYKYLSDREKKLKDDMSAHRVRAGVVVVVPARDVPVDTPLSSSDFVAREIDGDLVYDDMIRADNFDKYRMSHLVKPVRRGLPLRAADIDALHGRDFSDVLRSGTRAVTVDIDTVNSTALMLRPGNRVDVYWIGKVYHQDHSNDDTKVAQLMLANTLILATGQDMRPRDAGEAMQEDPANANSSAMSRQPGIGYTTVTLEVPVADAGRIALAQKIGGLRLILRNSDDKGANGPDLVQENDVFVDPGHGRLSSSGPAPKTVEIIAGGSSNSSTVLVSQGPSTASAEEPQKTAPAAIPASVDQPMPASPQRQPSLYEQANAIAQQLQKATARSTSKQN